MTLLEQTSSLLGRLIAYPTVSPDSNLEMIHDLANQLEDCGAEIEIFADSTGKKANLFATIAPHHGNAKKGGIILSGHSDVVPVTDQNWHSDPFVMTEREGKLFGRGSADMKGFIAACLCFARQIKNTPLKRPLHFAFTHDEETGCLGAQDLIPALQARGYQPAMAIIGEPTELKVIEGHKGCCEYTTYFSGLPGHGSDPEAGVNAAEFSARYILKLIELRELMKMRAPQDSVFDPPYTSMNIGAIRGGVAHNVIAPTAEIDWEFRPVNECDFTYFKSEIQKYAEQVLLPEMKAVFAEADIYTTAIGEVEGLEPVAENEAKALLMALTGHNKAGCVPFGTEAGLFQKMGREYGLSAVVCGPGSIAQAHKADEYISLKQLSGCLDMMAGLGKKIAYS